MIADEINALPENVRSYIHALETNADPAGEIRRCRLAEDENRMLRAKLSGPVYEAEQRLIAIVERASRHGNVNEDICDALDALDAARSIG